MAGNEEQIKEDSTYDVRSKVKYKIIEDRLESEVISRIEGKGLSSYLQRYVEAANAVLNNWSKERERNELIDKYLLQLEDVREIKSFKEFLIFLQVYLNFSLYTGVRIEGGEIKVNILDKSFEFINIAGEKQLLEVTNEIKNTLCWAREVVKKINSDWSGYTFIGAHEYSKKLWNIFKEKSTSETAKKIFKVLGALEKSKINKEFLNIDVEDARESGYSGKIEEYVEGVNLYYFYISYIGLFFNILGFKGEWERVYIGFKNSFKVDINNKIKKNKQVIEQNFRSEVLPVLDKQVKEYEAKYESYSNKVGTFKLDVVHDDAVKNYLIDKVKSIFVTSNVDIDELIKIIENFDEAKISESGEKNWDLFKDIVDNLKIEILGEIIEEAKEINNFFGTGIKFNKDKLEKYYNSYNTRLYQGFGELLLKKKEELSELCRSIRESKSEDFNNKLIRYLESEVGAEVNTDHKDKINLILTKYEELSVDKWSSFVGDLNIYIGEEQIEKYSIEYKERYKKVYDKLIVYLDKYNQIISRAEYLKSQVIEIAKYSSLINDRSIKSAHIVLWDEIKDKLENILSKFKNNLEKIAITSLYEKYKNANYQTRSDIFRQIKVKEIEYSALSTKVIEKGIFESENLKAIKELL